MKWRSSPIIFVLHIWYFLSYSGIQFLAFVYLKFLIVKLYALNFKFDRYSLSSLFWMTVIYFFSDGYILHFLYVRSLLPCMFYDTGVSTYFTGPETVEFFNKAFPNFTYFGFSLFRVSVSVYPVFNSLYRYLILLSLLCIISWVLSISDLPN